MLAECEQIFELPDGCKIKVVVQLLTTHRGIGAQVEYSHGFFVSPDDNFWTNIPKDSALFFVTDDQLKQVERKVWMMLEPGKNL